MHSGSTYKTIDVDAWTRREQFNFFRDFDNPFFGFTADLDVTALYRFAREQGYSFFSTYLFASQKAVNTIPEFRYRIKGDQVVEYPVISAGATILKENDVFTFCHFDHESDLALFAKHVLARIKQSRQADTPLMDQDDDLDQIFYSVIPWIHFKGVVHPRNHGIDDSVPRIVFGKAVEINGRLIMPISVEAHHALLDGIHVGIYYECLQNYFDQPKSLLER